jgi:ABC-type phosphate transport system auxiliary subunit
MNEKRYLKVKMLNLQQEVQALLAKAENMGAGTFDAIAVDIDKLTREVENLRRQTQPTTAADTPAEPEPEVQKESSTNLTDLYNEVRAVPTNTGIGNKDTNKQMYYLVDDDGNVNKLGKLNPDELKKAEAELEGNGFIMSEEDFRELRNIE